MKQISKKLTYNFIKAKRAYNACGIDEPKKKSKLLDKSTDAWHKLFMTNVGYWETELIESLACVNDGKESIDIIYKTLAMFGIEVVDE